MADNNMGRDRDLVLAPGEYAFVLDTTKGLVSVNVGPFKNSMSDTDRLVVWDKKQLRFRRVDTMTEAIQRDAIAPEGFYLALYNPAVNEQDKHPAIGKSTFSAPLEVGHRVNIPGPASFPLWPGQMSDVIRGHHLRSNQYLVAQVYNDKAASENWPRAVMRGASGEPAQTPTPTAFTPGQMMVIKGTDVSFFIPPTGVKVVPEESGAFVRDAVTLERLEYCILLDEGGNKRFVKGPDVVFPNPTETFVVANGSRKFRAIELNDTTGLYIKVIADYEDETGAHKAGEELFITGAEQALYYQREEHSIIRYGDQTKHYAVAIPAGEGRYVLNRQTGVVRLARGPQMLLCDPRSEVIVRRVLTDKEVALWYPGNAKALQINRELDAQTKGHDDATAYEAGRVMRSALMSYATTESLAANAAASTQVAGDVFKRGQGFTPPRTITLDTKYEGAVAIAPWAGYAVLIADKAGHRRVEEGPSTVLLEYDETLTQLDLSTGTPKTDNTRVQTVYLRVKNNRVSDRIVVETADLVRLTLDLSYRVNFEGDPEKWFAVENYVRLLCDHLRSRIRNAVKRLSIEAFYATASDVVRDVVLGLSTQGPRSGLLFEENGMRVYDVELLDVKINDAAVAQMLSNAQGEAINATLRTQRETRQLELERHSAQVTNELMELKAATEVKAQQLEAARVQETLTTAMAKLAAEAQAEQARLKNRREAELILMDVTTAEIARREAEQQQVADAKERLIKLELQQMLGETEEIVKRAAAMDGKLSAALVTLSDQAVIGKIVETLAPMAAMNGLSAAEVLGKLFRGTPLATALDALAQRSATPV